jgi:dinuclear metal center YbgI/SA1388 family protein
MQPKIKDVISCLETMAPPSLQESYDNAGLLTGQPDTTVTSIVVSLDCTEAVLDEAIGLGSNLVVAHHPIIFKGLKKLTGQTYVERTIIKAIKHDIAIYCAHTNLDNVHIGVNRKIAERLGLVHTRVLSMRSDTLAKLVTFVPPEHLEKVAAALHEAGAGQIGNYKNCSFQLEGTGVFEPGENATPFVGRQGKLERVNETRIEVILPVWRERQVLAALRQTHPYEEAAYYLSRVVNQNQEAGAGLIGETKTPEEPIAFLERLKKQMNAKVVRHTALINRPVKKVAVCGGSGSFLLAEAIAQRADVFISADFKYHEFFDADGRILVADIGHYESEQFTKDLFKEVLSEKFPNFAINFSKSVTNPISYL